jgi:hypothetical protein
MKHSKLVFRLLFIVVLLVVALLMIAAPVEADVSFNHAHLRVVQLAYDVEAASVALEDGTTVLTNLTPGTMSDYMTYPVNRSTFLRIGITPVSGLSTILEQPISPLASGYHSAVLVGSAFDNSLDLILIDEDTVCERGLSQGACIIMVNNIQGSPPLTFMAGNPVVEDAQYRRAVVNHVPAGSYTDFVAVDLTHPETVVFNLQPGFFEPNTIYFYGLAGTYPGRMFADYSIGSTRRVPVDIMTFLRGLTAERQLTDGARLFATENIVWVLEESALQFLLSNPRTGFTVFAPIDRAGFDIPTQILECAVENPQAIRTLILNHIISGSYGATDLLEAGTVNTMAGTTLTFTPNPGGDGFMIDNHVAVENRFGYSTVNGNVYLLDSVLIPTGFEEQFCAEG